MTDKKSQFTVSLIKLFSRIEEGVADYPTFIAFGKTTIRFQGIDMGGGQGKTIPVAWRYKLYINLFLVTLYFSWESE